MSAARTLFVDAETFSPLRLKDAGSVGVWRYLRHPGAGVWCVGYALDDGPVKIWVRGDPTPAEILAAHRDGCSIVAHHISFDRLVFKLHLMPRGWPSFAVDCTAARCRAIALRSALEDVAKDLRLPRQKIAGQLLTKPCDSPRDEDLQALYARCRQDVEIARALHRLLPPLPPGERRLHALNEVIGDRGAYTDGALIRAAIALAPDVKSAINAELAELTSVVVETVGQHAKIRAWLAARGCSLPDMQEETLTLALARPDLSAAMKRVIELRLAGAPAAAGKFEALARWRDTDARVRHFLVFYGTSTGRWSSRGLQAQNFAREVENTQGCLEAVLSGDFEAMRALGHPLDVLGVVSRCAIAAAPGHRLMGFDFAAIESVGAAWLTGETIKLDQWRKSFTTGDPGDDPYRILGEALGYRGDDARRYGKTSDLAFAYGGGGPAYRRIAKGDTISGARIQGFRDAWRSRHPKIVRFWSAIEQAAIDALRQPIGASIRCGRLTLSHEKIADMNFLLVALPSGRLLAYPHAHFGVDHLGDRTLDRFDRPALGFWDNDETKWQWTKRVIWGGVLLNHCVQGLCRDVLAEALLRLEDHGFRVILHIHDEVLVEMPEGEGDFAEFKRLAEIVPPWAEDMPIQCKARQGLRWGDANRPVAHIPGGVDPPPPKAKQAAKHAAFADLPPGLPAGSAIDPAKLEQLTVWAIKRETLRRLREARDA
jgi:DNA polymerase